MKLEHMVEFKRSALSGIAMACATVALCLKAIDAQTWAAVMTGAYGIYAGIRTAEEHGKRRNAHEAYISDNMKKAAEK